MLVNSKAPITMKEKSFNLKAIKCPPSTKWIGFLIVISDKKSKTFVT